ncbi:sigma-70 family RNA polymerase sigma factor [Solirubrobacter phytolaccae]|uniref:Sigma-70 family RNA polymerase sigma factor n=1 Tax=Solirubrobacter phytolaccae TaxID=1404360 RepID=A0A9X3NPH5_9ACTN|nr:sigma-70 family RNA polymerase sigma factor [Solirubrobacter phytolaccae]MDA0185172.1 sigma-70 family RNA polymerase sigma factor [Solirubrobacter phytolaccae]
MSYGVLCDAELIRRVADQDRHAFGELYARHAAAMGATARRVCRRPELAEDATQEAFLSLWRDAGGFSPRAGAPTAWVHTIVHNRSIDVLRRVVAVERRTEDDDAELARLPAAGLSAHDRARARECERRLAGAVMALPDAQREVIELAYYAGLSQREIADRLDLPLGTVKSRARLGLKRLALDADVLALTR